MKHCFFRQLLPPLLVACMLMTSVSAAPQDDGSAETPAVDSGVIGQSGYLAYLNSHNAAVYPDTEISADISGPVQVEEGGEAAVSVDVAQAGFYNVRVTYVAKAGNGIPLECGLLIDGTLPFATAESISLTRAWKDGDNASYQDVTGNEYHPVQEEAFIQQTAYLAAKDEYVDGGYKFWFETGTHSLTLTGIRESFVVQSLTLCQEPRAVNYSEYLAGRTPEAIDARPIQIEGEDAAYKSNPTLYSRADNSSSATSPYSPRKILLNTIGGSSWATKGQWIEWNFDVETAGFYKLSFRVKQNFKSGSFSVRKLYLDGEVPFAEAENIRFSYGLGWAFVTMGGDKPQYVWLDQGSHTLRLEVVYGSFADMCTEVKSCVSDATALYQQVIMITGSSPDSLRDYNLTELIPECAEKFADLSGRLYKLIDSLTLLSGQRGNATAAMEKLALQLDAFAEDPEMVPRRLSSFSANISSLASGMVSMAQQPLLLDYILLSPVGYELPDVDLPWYSAVWNEVQRLVYSFVDDYDTMGANSEGYAEKPVTIWLGIGRDQAVVLDSMIISDFTTSTGIPVNLRLISADVIMRAVAANQGPDLALYQNQGTVINYALRGAAYDLKKFSDFSEVVSQFSPETVEQYTLMDSVYALPEKTDFNVMYIRTDLMDSLGLQVPETWDDMYNVLAQLQIKNLQVGIVSSFTVSSTTEISPLFLSLLYQNGGSVYNEDGSQCILNSAVGVKTFTQFCELYTQYGMPLKIDLLTRFRTGETPVVINNISFGNELEVSAPELSGLWKMYPIPGTPQEDGTVSHTTVLSEQGTGAVMFSNAESSQNAWKFLKWWTGKQAQVEYARQIETTLGRSGRWLTANLDAMNAVAWSKEELNVIKTQLQTARCLPEVAGGYYTGRSVNNAVRVTVNGGDGGVSPKETLYEYVKDINHEISLKRKELGLQ